MNQNIRLVVALTVSMLLITAWQWFVTSDFAPEMFKVQIQEHKTNQTQNDIKQPISNKAPHMVNQEISRDKLEELINQQIQVGTRIKIDNDDVLGSINLVGAKIDDLSLKRYKDSLETDSPDVRLLSPFGGSEMHEVALGFLSEESIEENIDMPNQDSVWKADKKVLHANDSVTLHWINKAGVKFFIVISLDSHYMLSIKQEIMNNSGTIFNTAPYISINRTRGVGAAKNMILHEKLVEILFVGIIIVSLKPYVL